MRAEKAAFGVNDAAFFAVVFAREARLLAAPRACGAVEPARREVFARLTTMLTSWIDNIPFAR